MRHNVSAFKDKLLFDREVAADEASRHCWHSSCALNMYENYPFGTRCYRLGFSVILSTRPPQGHDTGLDCLLPSPYPANFLTASIMNLYWDPDLFGCHVFVKEHKEDIPQ